jgi:transformation/transcription domain-associated protein
VYCDRLGSNIQVVRRNSNSCRRITLHGSDGSLRTFLIQSSQVGSKVQASTADPRAEPSAVQQ